MHAPVHLRIPGHCNLSFKGTWAICEERLAEVRCVTQDQNLLGGSSIEERRDRAEYGIGDSAHQPRPERLSEWRLFVSIRFSQCG